MSVKDGLVFDFHAQMFVAGILPHAIHPMALTILASFVPNFDADAEKINYISYTLFFRFISFVFKFIYVIYAGMFTSPKNPTLHPFPRWFSRCGDRGRGGRFVTISARRISVLSEPWHLCLRGRANPADVGGMPPGRRCKSQRSESSCSVPLKTTPSTAWRRLAAVYSPRCETDPVGNKFSDFYGLSDDSAFFMYYNVSVENCLQFHICSKLTKTNRYFGSVVIPEHVTPNNHAGPEWEGRVRWELVTHLFCRHRKKEANESDQIVLCLDVEISIQVLQRDVLDVVVFENGVEQQWLYFGHEEEGQVVNRTLMEKGIVG